MKPKHDFVDYFPPVATVQVVLNIMFSEVWSTQVVWRRVWPSRQQMKWQLINIQQVTVIFVTLWLVLMKLSPRLWQKTQIQRAREEGSGVKSIFGVYKKQPVSRTSRLSEAVSKVMIYLSCRLASTDRALNTHSVCKNQPLVCCLPLTVNLWSQLRKCCDAWKNSWLH